MPKFHYIAVDAGGNTVQGTLKRETIGDVRAWLQDQSLFPIKIGETKSRLNVELTSEKLKIDARMKGIEGEIKQRENQLRQFSRGQDSKRHALRRQIMQEADVILCTLSSSALARSSSARACRASWVKP